MGIVIPTSNGWKDTEDVQVKPRMSFQAPMCSLCNRRVDSFRMERDGDKLTLIAECHGDTSTVTLKESQLVTTEQERAFRDPRRLKDGRREIKTPNVPKYEREL